MSIKLSRRASTHLIALSGVAALAVTVHAWPQQATAPAAGRGQAQPPPATLGLDHGTLDFDTPHFRLKLVKDSQTIAALEPKGAKGIDANTPFDFTPADQLTARQGDRFNHLGDIHIRLKQDGWEDGAWVDLASSNARKPVDGFGSAKTLPAGSKLLAGAILTPTMSGARMNLDAGRGAGTAAAGTPPAISGAPIEVSRSWLLDASGQLVLHFEIRNTSQAPVVIGGLGFPVVFNNMIQNFVTNRARTLPQAHEICSFFDPYVGRDAGYLQVTRLSGAGPALVVVPENRNAYAVRGVPSAERRLAAWPDVRRRIRMDDPQPGVRGERVEGRRSVESADVRDARARAVARVRPALSGGGRNSEHRKDTGSRRSPRRGRDSRLHRADGSGGEALHRARQAPHRARGCSNLPVR